MNSTKARKVLMSVAALAVTGAIAGAGTWASFSSTRTATQDVDAGTVSVTLNGGTESVPFGDAGNIAPGDNWNRFVTVANASSLDLASYTLSGADSVVTDSLTAAPTPLTVEVKACTQPWSGGATPTCGGTTSTVAAKGNAKIAAPVSLGSLTDASTSHLWFAFEMPAAANNDYQGDTSSLTYTFDAQQRTGAAQN